MCIRDRSYTQFKRLWQYIVTRTVKERFYYRYEDGKRVKHTVTPVLGEKDVYKRQEASTTRLRIAEHLRKLPMSFFNTKDLSDITTNMMAEDVYKRQGQLNRKFCRLCRTAVVGLGQLSGNGSKQRF